MPEIDVLLPGFSVNTDQATLGLCTVTLVRGEKLTVVDVGHFGRRTMLVETLKSHNISPEEIGRVILTHAHWDHSQNTDLFPNAEIVISKQELQYSRNPRANDYATAKYFADTLSPHTVIEVSGETALEKGLATFDTPGHTAGHQSSLYHLKHLGMSLRPHARIISRFEERTATRRSPLLNSVLNG